MINPGGPGISGIDIFTIGRGIPDTSPLRQYFDLVTWDPRGVRRSFPIRCSADVVAQRPATFPANESEFEALTAFNSRLANDCREQTGRLFNHVDTISTVRDLDAIRSALGEQKISYFGTSYGTLIGQQYAELFPHRIRALALDSNMDHSITSAYDYLRTTTDDLEGSFLQFAAWCDRTQSCALHGQDVVALWDALYAKATAGTLIDPDTGAPMSVEGLRSELLGAMFTPARWFNLAAHLQRLQNGGPGLRAGAAAVNAVVEYNYPAILCSDWHWDVSSFDELDTYRQRLETLFPHTRLSPFWSDVDSCLGWPGPVNNPQHRLKIDDDIPPTLMVKASEDVSTPKAWNYAAAEQIPGSRLLEYDGVGHGQYNRSTCARAYIENYLITLNLPPAGTHCPAEFPTQPLAPLAAPDDWFGVGRPSH
jgi:pimeloyl-ACP methyl ester carboxylesterase